ncbi:RNA-binding protein [Leptothermofonsia sichuanensis E412]|uniref:RNA recognition motif domain-containing protein n=1 Tax=Leptothermofonsia sichuanensis TaxID=2917832 RepID=UPI001CA7B16D|nr:RNA-binding protein [Leptothermofonsia sichuanensis]QZZ21362.1 RNA-binding protein [Leptothermofonsia sichuanensis E412]
MSVRLYVGNLPEELSRQELEDVFADAGDSISTKIITDRKTNKCRGFGFVTVKSDEQADEIIEKYNGFLLKDNALKVERAQPRTKEKGEDQPATVTEASASFNTGNRRKNNNNKSKRSSSSSQVEQDVQPDPRWAQELEKLKQLLAAQTTNS